MDKLDALTQAQIRASNSTEEVVDLEVVPDFDIKNVELRPLTTPFQQSPYTDYINRF